MSGPLDFGPPRDEERPPGAERAPAPEPEPEPEAPRPRPHGVPRSTWIIGVVALVLVVVIIMNAVGTSGVTPGGPDAEADLPPFAVPLADAPRREDEDAQVDPEKACRVRGAGILNICQEAERGPVVFALFPTKAARCRAVVDQFDRVAPRLRGVRLVAVGSQGDRDALRGRHPFPVGWDRDGGLATAYGLVGCPQITFARRGGRVVETTRQELSDADLVARARRLAR